LPSAFTVREYQPGDEEAVLETFNRVFAGIVDGYVPRTLAEWRWQYLENPAGLRMFLGFDEEGRVVSIFSGVPYPMRLEGEDATFVNAVDSCSDARAVRGLRKPGPFVVAGDLFAKTYGGPPPDRAPVVYGCPEKAAWRIGKRFLEYQLIRTQNKLEGRSEAVHAVPAAGVDVEEVERFPADVEALDAAFGEHFQAFSRRSPEHLDWRFASHPLRRYRIAVARAGGDLLGYAVFRKSTFLGVDDEGVICDWGVPPGREPAGSALLAWLAERARAEGCERLVTFLPDVCPDWIAFQRAGLRVRPTHHFLAARHHVRRHTMRWLFRNWYYTPADTDLC